MARSVALRDPAHEVAAFGMVPRDHRIFWCADSGFDGDGGG